MIYATMAGNVWYIISYLICRDKGSSVVQLRPSIMQSLFLMIKWCVSRTLLVDTIQIKFLRFPVFM